MERIKVLYERPVSRWKFAITLLLTILDMGSDLALALEYYHSGQYFWFAFTFAFFALITLYLLILLPYTVYIFCDNDNQNDLYVKKYWIIWKTCESMFEAGPQLLLQLYIMTRPGNFQDSHYQGKIGRPKSDKCQVVPSFNFMHSNIVVCATHDQLIRPHHLYTVLSPIKASLLIEAPPNFEGRFLL